MEKSNWNFLYWQKQTVPPPEECGDKVFRFMSSSDMSYEQVKLKRPLPFLSFSATITPIPLRMQQWIGRKKK